MHARDTDTVKLSNDFSLISAVIQSQLTYVIIYLSVELDVCGQCTVSLLKSLVLFAHFFSLLTNRLLLHLRLLHHLLVLALLFLFLNASTCITIHQACFS